MKKILIIEDDSQLNRAYYEKFKDSYEILNATDGASGILLAQNKKPNLIILDVMLPGGMNGFDVLRDLKNNSDLKDIPVVIVTNLDSQEESAQKTGAAACFVKANVDLTELADAVKKYI